jgi:glutamate decarboxylase
MLNEGQLLPIVALTLKDQSRFTVFDLSDKLRERGWIIAAYTLPKNADHISIMRVVVRENFSRDMAEMLLADIEKACAALEGGEDSKRARKDGETMHHIC